MALYAIIAPLDNAKIGPAIESVFEGNFVRVWNGQWFVSCPPTTPKEICEKLGIADGSNGSGIVLVIASYWGRGNPDLWPWMATRM